ncbi:MAG: hypothetical protein IJW37_04180 [Lachnospiraceae bacterium]|nr:hypothetical protein [Lachnospiraceae bacterium]
MSIIRNLYDAVYNNLIGGGAYLRIIKGCIFTVLIFALALCVGFALAAVLSFLRTAKSKALRAIGVGVTFLAKGTPVYLALLLWYYTFLGGMHRGGLVIAVLVLGIYGGGHMSDILSRAVKKETDSRSEAVNRRARREFFSALLPFVTEQSLFEFKRLVCILLQMSSLAGIIGVTDLAEVLLQNGLRTQYPFFALFCAVIFYLVLQLIIEALFAWAGKALTGEEEE